MNEPIKVLHIETGRNLYGGALQVLYLLSGLRQRGVRQVLVCPADSRIRDAAAATVERLYAVSMGGDLDLRFVWRLYRIIRRERPDVVHVHSRRGADILGGLAARLAGTRAVLTRRVDNPERHWLVGTKYRLYDRVVAISEGIRQVLIDAGVPAAKVVCARSAVDAGRYAAPCERDWFRTEFALDADARACGIIAQLIPRKGHRYLVEAIPAVLRAVPAARFVFFGKGPLYEELRDACARAGIAGQVRFAGYRDDLDRILGCLDVVAHPADMEGLGVALLQAAAAGVPIVASAVGGIPEIVRDGENGILIRAGDSAGLGRAITRLLQEPETARAYGAAGRRIVARDFSIDRMVAGNLAVYRALVGPAGT